MAVKAVPGSSLEVVETEFLFQLLRRLLVFLKSPLTVDRLQVRN
jgi:hypothetical protein